jgi:hypothetical protein
LIADTEDWAVNYNWNWGIFFETSPDGVHTYLETLLLGTLWTLATALAAWCLALLLGSLVGVVRTMPNRFLARLGDVAPPDRRTGNSACTSNLLCISGADAGGWSHGLWREHN